MGGGHQHIPGNSASLRSRRYSEGIHHRRHPERRSGGLRGVKYRPLPVRHPAEGVHGHHARDGTGFSPSVYSDDNGKVWAAFEANTGNLYVTERSAAGAVKNINTGIPIDDLTTPSITEYVTDPGLTHGMLVAFQGTNGHLDIYEYDITTGSSVWGDTGQVMWPGTSPSAVAANDGFTTGTELAVAFANSNNHIGVYYATIDGSNAFGNREVANTTLGMYAGTSPSITAISPDAPNEFSLAFEDNVSQLYLAYFGYGASQSSMHLENVGAKAPMAPGTSPSLVQAQGEGSNANEVSVYQGSSGLLCAWNDQSGDQGCFNHLVSGNPAVSLDGGSYWAAFRSASSGNFRATNTATGSYFEQPIYNNTNVAMSS